MRVPFSAVQSTCETTQGDVRCLGRHVKVPCSPSDLWISWGTRARQPSSSACRIVATLQSGPKVAAGESTPAYLPTRSRRLVYIALKSMFRICQWSVNYMCAVLLGFGANFVWTADRKKFESRNGNLCGRALKDL